LARGSSHNFHKTQPSLGFFACHFNPKSYNLKSSNDVLVSSNNSSTSLKISAQRKNHAITEGTVDTQPMYWLPAVEILVEATAHDGFTIVRSRGKKNPVKQDTPT
jgi:hypothetical protein